MHVLEGLGPQEQRNTTWSFEHPYDHPYFGQLFLGGALGTISYPDSINPEIGDVKSIEVLHLVPRILMAIIAVTDTFLIYKIAERRYNNRNVAFIAAILFAVMPMSWLVRRVLLDSLFMPFLLLSILFAIDIKKRNAKNSVNSNFRLGSKINPDNRGSLLIILSGIFLGLAVFTKITAFTFIPVVGLLVFTNIDRDWTRLGVWLVPVVLIPMIWPLYAIAAGEWENWLSGLFWQTTEARGPNRPIWNSIFDILKIDPVLFTIGMLGVLYAMIKKDCLIILWVVPFIVFYYFVGHLRDIHWIPIIPAFCIGVALLVVGMSNRISSKMVREVALITIFSTIAIFGLGITAILVSLDLNSTFFEIYAFISVYLPSQDRSDTSEDKTIIMGNNWMQIFSWIPKYVFDKDHDFKTFKRFVGSVKEPNLPVREGEKVLLLVDGGDHKRFILSETTKKNIQQKLFYNETKLIKEFKGGNNERDWKEYPYVTVGENPGIARGVEVRSNY